MEDLIFSVTRHEGFWAHIARSVPLRRVRSVYDHTPHIYHSFRKPGKWTEIDDARLRELTGKALDWQRIGELMECPADECRCRHQRQQERESRNLKTGKWSLGEEAHLNSIMQSMKESGCRPKTSPTFWKEVSRLMDHTRTARQCSNKWAAVLDTPRWREADSRLLYQKIALLDHGTEIALRWDDLIDEE